MDTELEIAEIGREIKKIKADQEELLKLVRELVLPTDMTMDKALEIKRIAKGLNSGDDAPLKEWNRKMKLKLGIKR